MIAAIAMTLSTQARTVVCGGGGGGSEDFFLPVCTIADRILFKFVDGMGCGFCRQAFFGQLFQKDYNKK